MKFTTSSSISVPDRELAPLSSSDPNITGLVAALFWSDGKNMDGRWLVVDASDPLVLRRSSLTAEYLRRTGAGQPGLTDLRMRIDEIWPAFLFAYLDTAKKGHLALSKELQIRHAEGQLQRDLPTHEVLAIDHNASMAEVVSHCGQSGSGRIFQRLFAYLLGLVGYRTVTVNTIGVPDVVASDLAQENEQVDLRLTVEQSRRLLRHCRSAGDMELESQLLSQDRRLT